jgi:hypothetical protein
MQATIKKNAKTEGHRSELEAKGYEVSENETHLLVEVSEVVDGDYDLTTDEGRAAVGEAIAQKKGFSYKTKWLLPEESRSHSGIFALAKLGRLSAFVMSGPKAPKKSPVSEQTQEAINDIL